jgi:hypothetical protein
MGEGRCVVTRLRAEVRTTASGELDEVHIGDWLQIERMTSRTWDVHVAGVHIVVVVSAKGTRAVIVEIDRARVAT